MHVHVFCYLPVGTASQKRSCQIRCSRTHWETSPTIKTPFFILIAISYPPISSFLTPRANQGETGGKLTGKQLRFKLKSQQSMFSSLTWHPFSHTHPVKKERQIVRERVKATKKEKERKKQKRQTSLRKRDRPLNMCFLFIISWLGASSFCENPYLLNIRLRDSRESIFCAWADKHRTQSGGDGGMKPGAGLTPLVMDGGSKSVRMALCK